MKDEKVPDGINLKYSSFDPSKKYTTYTNPSIPIDSKPKGSAKRGPTGIYEKDGKMMKKIIVHLLKMKKI